MSHESTGKWDLLNSFFFVISLATLLRQFQYGPNAENPRQLRNNLYKNVNY